VTPKIQQLREQSFMQRMEAGTNIVFDVRCLQDPEYAHRGVGRHAITLLRHAPRGAGVRRIGLIDPTLPQPLDDALNELDIVHPNATAAMANGVSCFIGLSPMTHDALFFARFLTNGGHTNVAVVYDFIPHQYCERYLAHPAVRIDYRIALAWLGRFDLFAPISRAVADELSQILHTPEEAINVTGAPLDEAFEPASMVGLVRSDANAHVLVVGGADPRKNVECAIRAHASSRKLQRAGVKLVIGGNYRSADLGRFVEIASTAGGNGELLRFPGYVAETELIGLYRGALCAVVPSRAEGFSLPIVESMAAGVPAFVSDISAHGELVDDSTLRFAPDDETALSKLIERAYTEPMWRAEVVTRQSLVWPRFRAKEVARRFWESIGSRLSAVGRPAVARGQRPRVALLSPLPPDRSGVADYTAATCRELSRLMDLHVFTECPRPSKPAGVASVQPLGALPHLQRGFDRVVSVAGNSHFHFRIIELLRRFGGACIGHDSRMLHFYVTLLGVDHACTMATKELRRRVTPQEINSWLIDESKLEASFLGEIVESASPTIVHSAVTARIIQQRYCIKPAYLPFSIYRTWTAEDLRQRDAVRARLGLAKDEVALASFGFVHLSKAPQECIWALHLLREWGIAASLHFVGSREYVGSCGEELRALAVRLGQQDNIRFLGEYVTEQVYRDYLLAADIGIQLRTFGLGGLSGALMDCIAVGLPTVTNNSLAEATGVPDYVHCIPDTISPILLAEALAGLLDQAAERPEDARRNFCETRNPHAYARRLCHALALEPAEVA
jgi:glycosyltransferase involved in cell wall biosynthesis